MGTAVGLGVGEPGGAVVAAGRVRVGVATAAVGLGVAVGVERRVAVGVGHSARTSEDRHRDVDRAGAAERVLVPGDGSTC
ncbi:MAG: hypothetical protein U0470_07665 [Anaerolineae bacterium]